MTDKKEYPVGYGRPPRHSQFQKGRSGNPSGKRKGARSLKADLETELSETVRITENGRTRSLTKQLLLLKTTFNRAVKGDARATSQVFELISRHMPPPCRDAENPLSAEEEALLEAGLAELLDRRMSGDD